MVTRRPRRVDAEARGGGLTLERGNAAFELLCFVALLSLVDKEHEGHHPRELVRGTLTCVFSLRFSVSGMRGIGNFFVRRWF